TTPPMDALRLVVETLIELTDEGRRPVVAVAGNHDSADLFEVLDPLMAPFNVRLVGAVKRPDDGGVLTLDTPAGKAVIGCFPFLREGRVVDFMAETGSWYGAYADRVRSLTQAYSEAVVAGAGREGVALLMAHFMVTGVAIAGHGRPRGERALHIGQSYAATAQAMPPGPQYVAMGHIHAPQPVPGSPVPAQYAGSLLELDFGESGEQKRVVIVDVEPGRPAAVTSVPLSGGRRLMRADGRWEELEARDDLVEAYVDLVVQTDGPDPALADRARARFPRLVRVVASYPRAQADRPQRTGLSWEDLYGSYVKRTRDAEPPPELLAAFREVWDEVGRDSE
ncbi:MAG: exonuclease SbcCD subunit D C-terminal domain-containing protein, partial [Acidimicrobiia bacterium]|nr:exonuclease SbcCD subunit D C-terminal domain-containing protein [Acidimicrobiia bacterium]